MEYISEQLDTRLRDEDIAILAFMCVFCKKDVIKKGLFPVHYAYYIPDQEQDLDVAKMLFEQNGINVRAHYSHIRLGRGQYALRMRYWCNKDYDKERNFFNDIIEKRKNLFCNNSKEEEAMLNQKVAVLREKVK